MYAKRRDRTCCEQVASILAQSRPVDELVVSDDASTDDTIAIIRRSVDEHAAANGQAIALKVIENTTPLGVTRNFEQAIVATTGDLIALCDQDDIWHADRIRTIVAVFEDPAVDLVFSDARLVDGDGTPLGDSLFATLSMTRRERRQLLGGKALDALLGRNLVTGATVVFRRRLLDAASPFGSAWVHDEWLAALAASTGGVRMLEAELIDYRQHGGNEIGAARLSLSRQGRSGHRAPRGAQCPAARTSAPALRPTRTVGFGDRPGNSSRSDARRSPTRCCAAGCPHPASVGCPL